MAVVASADHMQRKLALPFAQHAFAPSGAFPSAAQVENGVQYVWVPVPMSQIVSGAVWAPMGSYSQAQAVQTSQAAPWAHAPAQTPASWTFQPMPRPSPSQPCPTQMYVVPFANGDQQQLLQPSQLPGLSDDSAASGSEQCGKEDVRSSGTALPDQGASKRPSAFRHSGRLTAKSLDSAVDESAPNSPVGQAAVPQLMADLRAGGQACAAALEVLLRPGVVRTYSFQAEGCRLVQLALECAERQNSVHLASGLRGHVVDAIRSRHANHVVQKIISIMAPSEAPYIVEELRREAVDLAMHEYGCRIYQRLLEQSARDEQTARLIDQVLMHAAKLIVHQFGHHVINAILEHGLKRQQAQILTLIRKDALKCATTRNSAYVFVHVLNHGSSADCEALASDVLAWPSADLIDVASSHYGSSVVLALLQQGGCTSRALRQCLQSPAAKQRLTRNKWGRRVQEAIDGRLDCHAGGAGTSRL